MLINNKLFNKSEDFLRALERLKEVLKKDPKVDEAYIDATIKRFELVYELSWKLMKSYLEYNGIEVISPRETFRESFRNGLIEDASRWITMLENRNRILHAYDVEIANEIYDKIKEEYIDMFLEFSIVVKEKMMNINVETSI